jgi:glycosyltransferase involved in cell wall biosynthesis
MNFIARVRYRIIKVFNQKGLFLKVRFFGKISNSNLVRTKKLLIVAPGEIPIPPSGWGAVETIIWETVLTYEQAGFEVWLLNSKHSKDWKTSGQHNFDVILNHCDVFAKKIKSNWPNTKLVSVTHYGYAAFPEHWDKGYLKIIDSLNFSDYIICLSSRIYEVFSKYFDPSKLIVSSNGTSFSPEVRNPESKNFICVGKVEARKKQYELYKLVKESGLLVDFFGPIVDERVKIEMKKDADLGRSFRGSISRIDLSKTLSNYKYLILPSAGEADALVLYEAQMAGLEIVVEENALGAQDRDLKWVHILAKNPSLPEILNIIEKNKASAREISEHAATNYSWSVRNKNLVDLLKKISR